MYSGALQYLNNLHWDPNAEKFELKKKVRYKTQYTFMMLLSTLFILIGKHLKTSRQHWMKTSPS